MALYYEKVYLGREDTFKRYLTSDGAAVDISGLTRVTLDLGNDVVIDSATSPDAFDWATSGAAGVLICALGGESIAAGKYFAVLTTYAPEYQDGISGWGAFRVQVLDPEGEAL